MKLRPDIAPWTLGALVLIVTVCLSPIDGISQNLTVSFGPRIALLSMAAAGVGILGVWVQTVYVRDFPYPEAAWATRALRRLHGVVYVLGAVLMTGSWLSLLASTLMPATPRIALMVVILGVVCYAVRLGSESVARLVGLIGTVGLPLFVLMLVAMLPNADWSRLRLPAPSSSPPSWAWFLILFLPRGYIMYPVFGRWSRGAVLPAYLGQAAGGVTLAFSLLIPGLIFGWFAAGELPFPFVTATGTAATLFLPTHELSFVIFILWQGIIFAIASVYSLAALDAFGQTVFPLVPWKALIPLMLVVALLTRVELPNDIVPVVVGSWSALGCVAFFGVPLLLLLVRRVGGLRRVPA